MSLPTHDPLPRLKGTDELLRWAERLTNLLEGHLKSFALPLQKIILTNGTNNNIDTKGGMLILVSGPTAGFTITGIGGGTTGRRLTIYNPTGQNITIANLSIGSAAGNRIDTLTGGDVTSVGNAAITFIYEGSKWIIESAQL